MNKKRTIIIPFTLPWDWSADFQRQTCLELTRKGFNVIAYMNDDAYFFLKNKKKKYPLINKLQFYTPKYYIPLRRFKYVELINKYLSLLIFSFKILLERKTIWVFDPQFHYFSNFFINKVSIYDCVDFHNSDSPSNKNIISINEKHLINNSDLFFVNSHTLKTIHKKRKETINLVPQGFNSSEFEKYKKNNIYKKNNKITIGYVGGINYRLDYKLLTKLISNNPQWQFSFWGPVQGSQQDITYKTLENVTILKKFPNVKFNKTKDKFRLIEEINNFDVCLIPYDIKQPINLFSYPMKVFEYFYLGKPVISTPIKELRKSKFKNLIYIENSTDGFEKKINMLLKERWSKQKIYLQKRLSANNSWENKVSYILKKIYLID